MTATERNEFLHTFCDSCSQPILHEGCGEMFSSILEPIQCPSILADTHEICTYCLELHPKVWHHEEHCLFAKQHICLHAGGWATPASNHVLRSLRNTHFPYHNSLLNLLHVFLENLHLEHALLIPMPMGVVGRRNLWGELIQAASADIEDTQVLPLITRKKQQSIRHSVSQIRSRIVQDEYALDGSAASIINQRRVALIDDNVTTGITMMHGIKLLQQYSPSEVVPIIIERQISARLLQRCSHSSHLLCTYYNDKSGRI